MSVATGSVAAQTVWIGEGALAALTFGDLDGEPRNLADPALGGDPTLLVFSSASSSALDDSYLLQLQKQQPGLAIIGLLVVFEEPRADSLLAGRRFQKQLGGEWPVLLVGKGDTPAVVLKPLGKEVQRKELATTMLVDRSGEVRAVCPGLLARARTEQEQETRAQLRSQVATLLAQLRSEEQTDDEDFWKELTAREWFSSSTYPGGGTVRFHMSDDHERRATWITHGSGVPVLFEEELPVSLVSGAVWIGEDVWTWDSEARVLLHPTDFGRLLHTWDNMPGDYLNSRGFVDSSRWVVALEDTDPRIRREALTAIGFERAPQSASVFPEAIPLLQDPNREVARAAAWALGRVRDPQALEPLLHAIQHPSVAVRREITRALGGLLQGTEQGKRLFGKLEKDPDPLVRRLARRFLGTE